MGKAGVCIDNWKLPIFRKHLDAAGYKYDEPIPMTPGTLLIRVEYDFVYKLKPIIEAAYLECADLRAKHGPDYLPGRLGHTTWCNHTTGRECNCGAAYPHT